MQDTSKLMLTVVAGGVLMGAALSRMASPAMQFAAQPDWRQRYHADFSATPWQFSASLPEDLNPLGWTAGAMGVAQPAVEASRPVTYEDAYADEPAIDNAVYQAGEDAADTATSLDEAPAMAGPQPEQSQPPYEAPIAIEPPAPQLSANLAQ